MVEYTEKDMLTLSLYDELHYIECLPGWYLLLVELNSNIREIEKEFNMEGKVKAVQVKEKYGELRIYCSVDESIENHERSEEICSKIEEEVTKTEDASRHICEICSSHGEIINKSSYLMARCLECSNKD